MGRPGNVQLHPATALALTAAAWVLAIGLGNPWLNSAIALFGVGFGAWNSRSPRPALTCAGLLAPMLASIAVIYLPFGQVARAGLLALRVAALVCSLAGAATTFGIPELEKALPRRVGYLAASALQLGPQTAEAFRKVRLANLVAGRAWVTHRWAALRHPLGLAKFLLMPLMSHTLLGGVERGLPLEAKVQGLGSRRAASEGPAQLGLRARRQFLVPLRRAAWEPAASWLAPLGAVALVAGMRWFG